MKAKEIKWYGCYDPKGKICIDIIHEDDEVSKIIEKTEKEDIDDYYADANVYTDDDLKREVHFNTSIMLCELCTNKFNFEHCKEYRKRAGKKVFY